ncbi:MAG: type II secretion system ATPase GspE [Deltaproteobacteria bacterium]|nr:type II secretion system ATPase GspE [Deltaproteobacteria bacterium]
MERYVGDILVRHGALPRERVDELLALAKERGAKLVDVVVATQAAEEGVVLRALATEVGMEIADAIKPDQIPPELVEKVPIQFARQHRVLPIGWRDGTVLVAVGDPLEVSAADDLRALLRAPVETVAARPQAIADAINTVYERKDARLEHKEEGEDDAAEADELQDILDLTDEAPIIRWVNNLLYQAVKDRASDIHIEPEEREVVVRFRVDGELRIVKTANRAFMPSIVARVKIMAGMNIAEKRLPQDGRISRKVAGSSIDVRVSTIPTSRGFERIVMRILNKESVKLDLSDLGFSPDHYTLMSELITRPDGIILVTGPTGSGKTTTLYGCLNKINRPNLNILTAEDPVEYEIGGIHQVHVNAKIGLTFASALRAFLRQDPDVIMVGEIRDKETAEIAIHASLTGHLVMSTIHTNDAPGAVTRLVEMEIEPFLVRSTVIGVLAQRLVRRLCKECKEPVEITPVELAQLGIDEAALATRGRRQLSRSYRPPGQEALLDREAMWAETALAMSGGRPIVFRARGCERCGGSGYSGRLGIYELMMMDDTVGALILKNADATALRRAAVSQGMRLLREDGARKVLEGSTTVEEVLAATQADVG